MITYIIVRLRFKANRIQETQPLRVNTNTLLLDRFRHMGYHAAGTSDRKVHILISGL